MTQSKLEQDIQGPKYTVPDADYSADCANYLYLEKDADATGEIGCSASQMCNGFTGGAAFKKGLLEALVTVLPQKWDDILVNASQQLGSPTRTAQNGSLHQAGWKTDSYVVVMGETITNDLRRVVVVYFASYDRAYGDGICKTCTPK